MCSLEFISHQPAAWTSKLQAITMIICMMFYYSLAVDRDMCSTGEDDDVIQHKQMFTLSTTNICLIHTVIYSYKSLKLIHLRLHTI